MQVLTHGNREGPKRPDVNRGASVRLAVTLCLVLVVPAGAQSPVTPGQTEKIDHVLDKEPKGARLGCAIEPVKPFLDFAFRFDAGYIVRCPWKEFAGKESTVSSYVRVTPEGGKPVVLSKGYRLRAIPPDILAQTNLRKLKATAEASGAFSVGEGHYRVEVLVVDNTTGRACKKRWKVKAARSHEQRAVPVAMKAHTVAPMAFHPWDGKLDASGTGLRLTVLLDATPMNTRALKLRPWDQALLLESISALLLQAPCKSVRLTAFNLDQGREIFQQDRFDRSGFIGLAQALEDLELGTVSYRALQQQSWRLLLARLTNQEVTAEQPSDAVVFLGRATRISQRMPREMLEVRKNSRPRFFYLEYFPYWRRGNEFPDTLDDLTKARGGIVFKVHSPGELAQAIQKMLRQLKGSEEVKTRSRWPSPASSDP